MIDEGGHKKINYRLKGKPFSHRKYASIVAERVTGWIYRVGEELKVRELYLQKEVKNGDEEGCLRFEIEWFM